MEELEKIKHFDKIFGTNLSKHINSKMPLLKNYYYYYMEELYTPSEKYAKIQQLNNKQVDNLVATFSEKQNKMFDHCMDTMLQMDAELEEQLFLFGFLLAKQIEKEVEIK